MNPEAQRGGDAALSLRSALVVLRRRFLIVILCAVAVPLSAFAFSQLQEKQYTADASLLFRDPALDQKLFGSTFLQRSQDPDREAATNVRLVSLEAVAARTAAAVPGRLTPGEVTGKVAVSAEGQSDVVSVKATDTDPRFAARLANAFAEQYIAFRRQADRSKVSEAQQLVERQLDPLPPEERSGPRGSSLAARAEQLQILASLQTGNAELVQRARVPASPSSPRTLRNVVLGAVLGLLLGVALAFLLERLDRRVRDPRELEEIFDRPVLASVPQSRALARVGSVHEDSLPPAEQEAFRMLRANLRYFNVDHPVRSVLVTSAAPGDGKTTVAWNLAFAAAGTGAKALMIEADLRRPSLATASEDLAAKPGLSTVLAGQAELGDAVQPVAVRLSASHAALERSMDVLVAGPLPPNPVDLIESDRMRGLIHEAERLYDLVVVDTPPTSVVSDAIPLLKEVSGVLVVGRVGKSTRDALHHLRNQLVNLDAPTLGVVVNALADGGHGYGYGYAYGYTDGNGAAPVDEREANAEAEATPPAARS